MNNTQLKAYPYKRAQIRATLLTLLSDDHIRTVSPTTRRLVERNLKADWCVALSPAPSDDKDVEAEAQLAKHMSALALKDPAMQHLRVDDTQSMGSTLSVNAVADADVPYNRSQLVASPTSTHGHHTTSPSREHHVGHSRAREVSRLHGLNHTTIEMPHHHDRQSSTHSKDGSGDGGLSASAVTVPMRKKHRTPPPRPPKKHVTSSLPATPPAELELADVETASTGASSSVDTASIASGSTETVEDSQVDATTHALKTRCRRAPPPTPHRKRKTSFHGQSV
jgi:hypothetical protein